MISFSKTKLCLFLQNISTGPLKLDYKTLAALPTTSLQKINRVRVVCFLCYSGKRFSVNPSSHCLPHLKMGVLKVVNLCSSFWKWPSWLRISASGIPCFSVLGACHPALTSWSSRSKNVDLLPCV